MSKKFTELRKMSNNSERKEWLGKMTKIQLIAYYEAQFDKKINASFLNSKKKIDVIQAVITLFDNTRRDEAFENYGKNVEKCSTISKAENNVEKPRKNDDADKKIAEAKRKLEEMIEKRRKMQPQPRNEEKVVEKEKVSTVKFAELRGKSNVEVKEWLEKMSKPQLIAYYEAQFDKKINATYLKNKSKKDVIQSIMNLYDTQRRSEAMEKIKV